MKNVLLILLLLVFCGCETSSESLTEFIEDPPQWVKDPHYAQYQSQLDDLEKEYLNKSISYSQYLERKSLLDEKYSKGETQRRDIIMGNE